MTRVSFTLNDEPTEVEVTPDVFLLDLVRNGLDLTGSKECCLEGECGACTVIVDGRSVNSCLIFATEVEGAAVRTIEGLDRHGVTDLQEAFLDNAAAQCGFCIPGQLMAATAFLETNENPTRDEVRAALAGNLCRCAGYEQITEAVLDAATRMSR